MLRVSWTTPAADEFERNQSFYANVNPRAAQGLAERVHAAISQLRSAPHLGRPGLRTETREWIVTNTPYLVVYRLHAGVIEILHVFHQRQDWTHAED